MESPQPPPSATDPGFAEHGSHNPSKRNSNLRLRRPTNHSPNTEVTGSQWNPQTSPIGDKSRIRRTRRIHARKTGPKTPSSATHQPTRRTRQLDHPKTGSQTSVFGAPVTTRRRRKLQVRNSARNEKGLGTHVPRPSERGWATRLERATS